MGNETGEAHRSPVSRRPVSWGQGQVLSSRHMSSESHRKGMELVGLEQGTNWETVVTVQARNDLGVHKVSDRGKEEAVQVITDDGVDPAGGQLRGRRRQDRKKAKTNNLQSKTRRKQERTAPGARWARRAPSLELGAGESTHAETCEQELEQVRFQGEGWQLLGEPAPLRGARGAHQEGGEEKQHHRRMAVTSGAPAIRRREELAFCTGKCEPKVPAAHLRPEASPGVVFPLVALSSQGGTRVDDGWVPG